MIQFSEILSTNRMVMITPQGIEAIQALEDLHVSMKKLRLNQRHLDNIYEDNSEYFHLVSNLQIWVDEKSLGIKERVAIPILYKRIETKLQGAFNDMKEFNEYLEAMKKNGLIEY